MNTFIQLFYTIKEQIYERILIPLDSSSYYLILCAQY